MKIILADDSGFQLGQLERILKAALWPDPVSVVNGEELMSVLACETGRCLLISDLYLPRLPMKFPEGAAGACEL